MRKLLLFVPLLFLMACSPSSYEKIEDLSFDVLVNGDFVSFAEEEQHMKISNFEESRILEVDIASLEKAVVEQGDKLTIQERAFELTPYKITVENREKPGVVLEVKDTDHLRLTELPEPGIWTVTVEYKEPRKKMYGEAVLLLKVVQP